MHHPSNPLEAVRIQSSTFILTSTRSLSTHTLKLLWDLSLRMSMLGCSGCTVSKTPQAAGVLRATLARSRGIYQKLAPAKHACFIACKRAVPKLAVGSSDLLSLKGGAAVDTLRVCSLWFHFPAATVCQKLKIQGRGCRRVDS